MTRAVIQLSPRGKAIYQFLSLTTALLPLYCAGFLLSAFNQLPAFPLPELFAARLNEFSAQAFNLLGLTGFIAAGAMMASEATDDEALARMPRLWLAVVALAAALGVSEHALLADMAVALALLAILLWTKRFAANAFCLRTWRLGLLLTAVSLPASRLATGATAAAIAAFQVQVAFGLCALSVAFWLMPRITSCGNQWARRNQRTASALLILGGSLTSLGRTGLPGIAGLGAASLILLSYILLASHLARPLRERSDNNSLARQWLALAIIFWLVGSGILGALGVERAFSQAMRGADPLAAQDWLVHWTLLALVLAFVNEAATSLRGDNQRVTGYAPLWLIAFGAGLSFVAQLCRGVARYVLREFAGSAPASEPELLLPLTLVTIACLIALSAGVGAYALGFFMRRPRIRVVER